MNWIKKLQERWKVRSAFQVFMILLVFTCTGLTVVYLMKPILRALVGEPAPVWARIGYYVLILPVYNAFLLMYGFIFGQFRFFWDFERRLYDRILSIFKKKTN